MDIIENVLGHASGPEWKERLEGADVDVLELTQWDAQKNRLRGRTAQGRELAVALERGGTLHDGDVLMWDEAARRAVLCRIRLCPVMAVEMGGLAGLPVQDALSAAVRLGHALGNQHWPAVVKGSVVYVPMTVDRAVAAAVMDTHAVPGTSYAFISGEDAARMLDPAEARRLFGGAEMPLEGGRHSHPHSHAHPAGGCHGHGHGGHEHGKHGEHGEDAGCPSSPGHGEHGGESACVPPHDHGATPSCAASPADGGVTAHAPSSGHHTSCPGHASREEAEACPVCRRHAQA